MYHTFYKHVTGAEFKFSCLLWNQWGQKPLFTRSTKTILRFAVLEPIVQCNFIRNDQTLY